MTKIFLNFFKVDMHRVVIKYVKAKCLLKAINLRLCNDMKFLILKSANTKYKF